MRDFIDKTSTQSGTPINRVTMMALQDFETKTTVFNADGSITETNALGQTLTTVLNQDGSVTETFIGEKTIIKTTKFDSDGNIEEVIS